jgi:hypothetical protein
MCISMDLRPLHPSHEHEVARRSHLVRFSFLFLFHLLTTCFSFIHIPSRLRLCHTLPLCPPSLCATLHHALLSPSPCRAALATSPLISCVASVVSRLPFAMRHPCVTPCYMPPLHHAPPFITPMPFRTTLAASPLVMCRLCRVAPSPHVPFITCHLPQSLHFVFFSFFISFADHFPLSCTWLPLGWMWVCRCGCRVCGVV